MLKALLNCFIQLTFQKFLIKNQPLEKTVNEIFGSLSAQIEAMNILKRNLGNRIKIMLSLKQIPEIEIQKTLTNVTYKPR